MQRHANQYKFIGIYIAEAHAIDEWPISESPRNFQQHQTIEERYEACNYFLQDYSEYMIGFEFYVDTVLTTTSFESTYASWPFRFWVLSSTKVLYKAMPKDATYDLNDLDKFLTNYYSRCQMMTEGMGVNRNENDRSQQS